jgi:phosphonate transport system substrate-binding protein
MNLRSALVGVCTLAALVFGAHAAAQVQPLGTVVEVQRGDTFSAIAGRFAGSTRSWSRVYDAKLSGLPDPNRIVPGMRLELVADSAGRRYLRVQGAGDVISAAAPTPAPSATPAEPDALVIGVLPFISASVLAGQYDNLKSYLERTGSQKVRIVVPAGFKAFFDSTIRGDYDLAVSAPHFARVAQLDARMVPLAIYEPRIPAQFISALDNPVADAAAVRGKVVAFANPTSLVAMFGQQWLRQQNLEPGRDYEVRPARTDMGVGRMLLTGDAVAAVMSGGEFRALAPEESARLKITEVFARIPNFIVVGHPRLGKERLANLKTRMLGFMADKAEGAAFAKATGLSGIVEVEESVLRELDPHVAATRRLMGGGN